MLEIILSTESIPTVKLFEPGRFTRIGENLYFTSECDPLQNTANVVQLTPTFRQNSYRLSPKQLLVKERMIYGKQVLTEPEMRKAYTMFFNQAREISLKDVLIMGNVPTMIRGLLNHGDDENTNVYTLPISS